MKVLISIALFFLLVSSSAVFGQAVKRRKSEPKDRRSVLSPTTRDAGSVARTKRETPASNPATDPSAEAQKNYDSGVALAEAGKLQEAIEAFKESLKYRPNDPDTNFILGMTYSKSKSYKEALEAFTRVVRLKPDWAEAHFRLGLTSYLFGTKDLALDEYRTLLKLKSPLAATLYQTINDGDSAQQTSTTSTNNSQVAIAPTPNSTPAPSETSKNTNAVAAHPTPEITRSAQQLTEIYRVGVGDVLDVRLLNSATSRSTLFTVVSGGLIDLPVAGGPIAVAGLTVDEIQTRIASELRRRAVEDGSPVSVGVRQFASHSVAVTGLVGIPGTKFLRREAVPLYVIMAEAQLRNDAGRITIMRSGATQTLDLSNPATLNVNVMPGDVITVSGRPQEFYYIAGRINYPGQKVFQSGITLLQAILAAGGTSRQNEKIVEISREGSEGRLATTRFNIKQIKLGLMEDPKIQPGDRIEVVR